MKSREYRESFVASHVSNTIAAQIFMMREDREWTQKALAEKAGMKQSRISAIEDPDFENIEIATLRRLASAFDVGLSVRFVPFSEIAVQAGNVGTSDLCVMNFDRDTLPIEQKPPSNIFVSTILGANEAKAGNHIDLPWITLSGEGDDILTVPPISSADSGLLDALGSQRDHVNA